MSLENPTFLEKATAIAFSKTGLLILGLIIVLVGSALYITDCGSSYFFNRGVDKLKANVNAAINDAANIKQQEANLEQKKIEANANVNAAVSDLQRQTYGHEQDKAITNQALANFNKALASNSNIDRTAEDLKRQIERLDSQ
jgi:hypothetical protein